MCFACEREEMLAAYRDYLAARRAAAERPGEGAPAGPAAEPEVPDWAKGTWFAAAIERKA